MSSTMARVRRAVMGVSDREALAFSRGDTPAWKHLESVVGTAVGGYHLVLDDHRLAGLVPRLEAVEASLRGYAYEGAAMGLTGMDLFLPGSRFRQYVAEAAQPHLYMVHIGAGEALARLRRSPEPFLRRLDDPVVRWLVMDGYGFHEGFFKPRRHVRDQRVPVKLSPFAARVFDQGVGRSIYFAEGADAGRIARSLAAFPEHRQADLWLGVGVACGYVGGMDREQLLALRESAGEHAARIAVGVAFVSKGRIRAGNPIPDTGTACEVFCGGISTEAAADIVDEAWLDLPDTEASPAYDALQNRLAARFDTESARESAVTAGPALRRAS
jgi:hypothetical protein